MKMTKYIDAIKYIFIVCMIDNTQTMNVIKIHTSQQLSKNIMHSSRPAVITFTGKTCKPCKLFIQKLLDTNLPIDVYDVDFYSNKSIAKVFNIGVLPTAIFIDEKQPVGRMNGLKEYDDFIDVVENIAINDCVVVHWN